MISTNHSISNGSLGIMKSLQSKNEHIFFHGWYITDSSSCPPRWALNILLVFVIVLVGFRHNTNLLHQLPVLDDLSGEAWNDSALILPYTSYLRPNESEQVDNGNFARSNDTNNIDSVGSNDTQQHRKLRLRLDWTNLEPHSELTKRMVAHQSNCSAPMGTFVYRNRYGLGSDLHVWGQALFNGLSSGERIRTIGPWIWGMDPLPQEGDNNTSEHKKSPSPMLGYFPHSELKCPGDIELAIQQPKFDPLSTISASNGNVHDSCQDIYQGNERTYVRRSATEYLFSRVSPELMQEAERQLNLVFDGLDEVPEDLITVHVRWGDKKAEMKLVEIDKYIESIQNIIDRRQESMETSSTENGTSNNTTANIFLCTEDPEALEQFQEKLPADWNLYIDRAYDELAALRIPEYNGAPKLAKTLHGKMGLIALGSLLVAMEANDFVLTTESNWSRLLNELRQTIIDPRCGNCTTLTDLRPARHEW